MLSFYTLWKQKFIAQILRQMSTEAAIGDVL